MLNETAIFLAMNDKTFGLRESASIVGGMKRLSMLLDSGQIRYTKKSEKQNAKLFCNAWDVLKHASIERARAGRPRTDAC